MFRDHKGYRPRTVHPDDAAAIRQMTESSAWDSTQFNQILVALATVGNGESIPAANCPNTIQLQRWRKFIDDLLDRTSRSNREHARAVLADTQKKTILMSGKISAGSESEVNVRLSKQPGRERHQSVVATIHTHPTESGHNMSHGFSGQDYISLLSEPEQQAILVAYGNDYRLMVLKTSVTPNDLEQDQVERRIKQLREEYLGSDVARPENQFAQLIHFNKAVCTEFGLVFYMASRESNDLFRRVPVTDIE